MTVPRWFPRSLAALGIAALLAGCAATPMRADDPFEPMNRASYKVHEVVDGHFVKPIAQVYVDYTPKVVQKAVSNFFGNIDDAISAINDFLQGKPDKGGNDLGRVLLNTGFGLGGLIDIASEAGIPKGNEDFGQTLGVWGLPQGPYLFIPVFGPTTVRDGTGWLIRYYIGPVGYIPDVPVRNTLYGLGGLDMRASLLPADKLVEEGALDPYAFIRRAYLQHRLYMQYDGKPPPVGNDNGNAPPANGEDAKAPPEKDGK
ncbi:MAG TPA: VacJ family lipoprotein [Casimicrobiaceae bacterium]|nr:VacJ family lipoprotein [Casimicrobiaceae bacterium]